MFLLPLSYSSSLWCACLLHKTFASRKRSSLKLWRTAFNAGPLTDVWARHTDGCTHINTHTHAYTHYARRGVCSVVRLQEENLPWHHPGECRCRAGTGSESQEAWWGRVCHATDRLWDSRVKECELDLIAELVLALRLWNYSLHKQACLISLCNQVDEACVQNKWLIWKLIYLFIYHCAIHVTNTILYNILLPLIKYIRELHKRVCAFHNSIWCKAWFSIWSASFNWAQITLLFLYTLFSFYTAYYKKEYQCQHSTVHAHVLRLVCSLLDIVQKLSASISSEHFPTWSALAQRCVTDG